jgi:hypothetical protein
VNRFRGVVTTVGVAGADSVGGGAEKKKGEDSILLALSSPIYTNKESVYLYDPPRPATMVEIGTDAVPLRALI